MSSPIIAAFLKFAAMTGSRMEPSVCHHLTSQTALSETR